MRADWQLARDGPIFYDPDAKPVGAENQPVSKKNGPSLALSHETGFNVGCGWGGKSAMPQSIRTVVLRTGYPFTTELTFVDDIGGAVADAAIYYVYPVNLNGQEGQGQARGSLRHYLPTVISSG